MKNTGVSYTKAKVLISSKTVKVNNKKIKENITVYEGDKVTIDAEIEKEVQTIYEDDKFIVAYKDVGVSTYDVMERLLTRGVEMHMMYRLETNAQGLVMFAKNVSAYNNIQECFERGELQLEYLVVVSGKAPKATDKLIAYLRYKSDEDKVQVFALPGQGRKMTFTEYETLDTLNDRTLLAVKIHTCFVHQIRAHLAFVGMPILGDSKYGITESKKKSKQDKLEMISSKITFLEPNGELEYLNGKTIELDNAIEKLSFEN